MPEEIELDTDKLRETIDDEIEKVEKAGAAMLRWVALYTAVLAAVTAVVSLHAGSTINEALVLKSEATSFQAQASDQWAFYQAKGIKGAIALSAAQSYAAAGRAAPDSLAAQAARYTKEQGEIQTEARKLEAERDARSHEADSLLEHHHHYAFAVALLQVSIALGAVAALTRQKAAFGISIVAGVAGAGLALFTALSA
ncbi:MAG TPA: DUF4337 domain-containing protein [Gemmatimonadaceae bacterium]|nr:DUF4337 domain-containing protein [Gemmatimonadaceae bacterium]